MRELNANEIEEVNGGFLAIGACLLVAGLVVGGVYLAGYLNNANAGYSISIEGMGSYSTSGSCDNPNA